MNVTKIAYGHGNPDSPYFGRIELALHSGDRFEASYEHGGKRRAWHGILLEGTFARAIAALTNAGFPQAPPLAPLVPGSSPLDLGWEANGAWQRIRLAEEDRSYDAFHVIASTILSVLDTKLARMPPGQSSSVIEVQLGA